MVKNIFTKLFKKTNQMRIESERYEKTDGIYFDIKVYGIIEPLNLSTRELAEKHLYKFSSKDKKTILEAYKFDFRYRLVYVTNEEFMLYDLFSGEDVWIDLNYRSLKKFSDGALTKRDIIKITQRIEHENTETNDNHYSVYGRYKKNKPEANLTLIK